MVTGRVLRGTLAANSSGGEADIGSCRCRLSATLLSELGIAIGDPLLVDVRPLGVPSSNSKVDIWDCTFLCVAAVWPIQGGGSSSSTTSAPSGLESVFPEGWCRLDPCVQVPRSADANAVDPDSEESLGVHPFEAHIRPLTSKVLNASTIHLAVSQEEQMLPVALAAGLRHKLVTLGCRVYLGGRSSCVVVASVPSASGKGGDHPSVFRILPSTVLELAATGHGTITGDDASAISRSALPSNTSFSPADNSCSPVCPAETASSVDSQASTFSGQPPAASSIRAGRVGAGDAPGTKADHQGPPPGRRVAGMRAGLAALREAVLWPIQYAELAAVLGVQWPGGILLHGPSGVGKTLLVHAVAEECGAQLFTVNPGDVFGAFTGESEQRLREAFQKAEDATSRGPVVLFLDEVDAYAARRDGRRQHESRVVAQLLTLMDGVTSKERAAFTAAAAAAAAAEVASTGAASNVAAPLVGGAAQGRSRAKGGRILVVAATSRPNALDPALRRPGRFDREVAITMPNAEEREEILALHASAMPLARGLDLRSLATTCTGYTGADLASLCREASLIALRRRFSFDLVEPASGNLMRDDVAAPEAAGMALPHRAELSFDGADHHHSSALESRNLRMGSQRGPSEHAHAGPRVPEGSPADPDAVSTEEGRDEAWRAWMHAVAGVDEGMKNEGMKNEDMKNEDIKEKSVGRGSNRRRDKGPNRDLEEDLKEGSVDGLLGDLDNESRENSGDGFMGGEDMVRLEDFQAAMEKLGPSLVRGMTTEVPTVTWDDIGGLEPTKRRLAQVIEWPITHADAFQRLGLSPPRGVLLFGPPGCCKTTLAKAAANAAKTPLFTLSGADLFSMYVGEGERTLRDTFRIARLAAPSILFFDEVDAVAARRGLMGGGGGASAGERLLSTLLTEMDGLEAAHGILVLAATNRPHAIDAALMRPGRLELVIYVPPPDETGREAILRIHTRKMSLGDDVDLPALAHDTANFTGAELESLCREAGMMALRETLSNVTVEARHFQSARAAMSPALTPLALASFEHFAEDCHK